MAHVIATSPLSATSCSPLSRSYSPRVSGGAGFAVDEEGRSSTYVMVNGVSVRSSTARQALWPQRAADRHHFRQARRWADRQRRGTARSPHSPAPKVLADTEVDRVRERSSRRAGRSHRHRTAETARAAGAGTTPSSVTTTKIVTWCSAGRTIARTTQKRFRRRSIAGSAGPPW